MARTTKTATGLTRTFKCSNAELLLKALEAYNYATFHESDFDVAVDYFNKVVLEGRREMGHYFIVRGKQGRDFQDGDPITFVADKKLVATATITECVEGPHGSDGGDRFFYLADLDVVLS